MQTVSTYLNDQDSQFLRVKSKTRKSKAIVRNSETSLPTCPVASLSRSLSALSRQIWDE